MSDNCVRCIKNKRTGFDLLCDECREYLNTLELCQQCKRRYRIVWNAPDDMYRKVTGLEDLSGLFCIECFDDMARSKGIELYWSCNKEGFKEGEGGYGAQDHS